MVVMRIRKNHYLDLRDLAACGTQHAKLGVPVEQRMLGSLTAGGYLMHGTMLAKGEHSMMAADKRKR